MTYFKDSKKGQFTVDFDNAGVPKLVFIELPVLPHFFFFSVTKLCNMSNSYAGVGWFLDSVPLAYLFSVLPKTHSFRDYPFKVSIIMLLLQVF